ncbi:MAG TPA: hypothetical protein VL551_16005 [Actinospica sp.]|nr:hypothetical protein [Actinospica sp.]
MGELGDVDGLEGVGEFLGGDADGGVCVGVEVRCCLLLCEEHGGRQVLALRQGDFDAGALADLAVSDLAAVASEQGQQEHAQQARGGQGQDAGRHVLGVLLQRGLLHVGLGVDRSGAGYGGRAAGREVVPADRRVGDGERLGLALHGVGDEARAGQCVVDALVALTGAHIQQCAGEAVA